MFFALFTLLPVLRARALAVKQTFDKNLPTRMLVSQRVKAKKKWKIKREHQCKAHTNQNRVPTNMCVGVGRRETMSDRVAEREKKPFHDGMCTYLILTHTNIHTQAATSMHYSEVNVGCQQLFSLNRHFTVGCLFFFFFVLLCSSAAVWACFAGGMQTANSGSVFGLITVQRAAR